MKTTKSGGQNAPIQVSTLLMLASFALVVSGCDKKIDEKTPSAIAFGRFAGDTRQHEISGDGGVV